MKMRKDVFTREFIENTARDSGSSSRDNTDRNEDEDFFWKLHNSDPESWTKYTDFGDETFGIEGTLYTKSVEGYPV